MQICWFAELPAASREIRSGHAGPWWRFRLFFGVVLFKLRYTYAFVTFHSVRPADAHSINHFPASLAFLAAAAGLARVALAPELSCLFVENACAAVASFCAFFDAAAVHAHVASNAQLAQLAGLVFPALAAKLLSQFVKHYLPLALRCVCTRPVRRNVLAVTFAAGIPRPWFVADALQGHCLRMVRTRSALRAV